MPTALRRPDLAALLDQHGSPLNLLSTAPMVQNIADLNAEASQRDLDFRVYFARKANKCLGFVDAAHDSGAGIDVASGVELDQVLRRRIDPQRVICTAAIKDRKSLTDCVRSGVTIAVDNADELLTVQHLALHLGRPVNVAVRVSGFQHEGQKLHSRFGVDVDDLYAFVVRHWPHPGTHPVTLQGLHFHLDGYSAAERISAINELMPLVDRLRDRGHRLEFLDIGGGIPMSYLQSESQWQTFWQQHEAALLGQREPITYRNHGLGRVVIGDAVHGSPQTYPYHQSPTQADWLAGILDAPFQDTSNGEGGSIADALRRRQVQLRCEPGRSILDGCGVTVARVEFRKQHPDGSWLIGLAMNRTQCRTSSVDFLVDPLWVPTSNDDADRCEADRCEPGEGYLVGAYCTESELLSLRRLKFPQGVAIGDLVAFPNTAGYLMHFLESRSHQFPLAKNLLIDPDPSIDAALDDIDRAN